MSGLLRSNVVVAGGTALSRVTGFLRLTVLLYVIGQTALSDAYLIANETPNIVYDLLLGGLLSATLVPLFSTFVETDDDESTNVVITVAVAAMAALTLIAVAAAPLIFGLYSFNIAADVDPDVFRVGGDHAGADLPDPDLLLRPRRVGERLPQQPSAVLRRGVGTDPAEPHHHRILLSLPDPDRPTGSSTRC
jgi:hypothetical protein